MVTQKTDLVYRIQCHPIMHLDRLAPYLEATQDEQPLRRQTRVSKGRWEQSMCSYGLPLPLSTWFRKLKLVEILYKVSRIYYACVKVLVSLCEAPGLCLLPASYWSFSWLTLRP